MAHDGKKILVFVKEGSRSAEIIKAEKEKLLALRASWVAKNPDVTQEPITIDQSQKTAFNVFITDIENAINSANSVINEFKVIDDANPHSGLLSMDSWD